jgi:hypothetical protein
MQITKRKDAMPRSTAEVLRAARELYASAPAHCPPDEYPPPGTYCPITAARKVVGHGANPMPACGPNGGWPKLDATHTTDHVLWAFDLAIARAEGREPRAPRYRIECCNGGEWRMSTHDLDEPLTWTEALAIWRSGRLGHCGGLPHCGNPYRVVEVQP